MKLNCLNIFIIGLFLISSSFLKSENQLPEGAEEGLFSIKYSVYSLDVSTVMYKDSVFIPFTDLLNMLKVYYDISDRNDLKGYVFNKDSSFSLNINKLSILDISNKTSKITEQDFVKTNLELYVLPSVIERIFHVNVYVKTKQLKIHIVSDYKFPLLLEDERLNKYNSMRTYESSDNVELPLLYDRNWSLIDGGMIDYNITGSQSGERQLYGFGGNIGFQLLGGEMQYNINSNYDIKTKILNKNDNYRWRYNFSENKIISQIAIGSITNSQSRGSSILNMVSNSRLLVGIQFSNESIKMPTSFSTFTIQDKIEPDWQVELYVADQLFAQTRTDNLGYYRFELPIKYGNTNIEIKIYGPHGEFVSKKDIISIPGEILIPGEIKYNFGVGQDIYTKKYIGNALISLGITEWFTNTINFEKEYEAQDYFLVDNSSFRLFSSILLNTSISPNKFYKGGTRVIFDKLGTYDFIYSLNNPLDTLGAKSQSLDVSGGFPRPFDLPLNFTFRGNRTESENNSSNTGNVSLSINIDRFYISTRYGVSYNINKTNSEGFLNQNIDYQIDYSWYNKPNFLSFLGNTRFSLNSAYLVNSKEITSVGLNISQEIAKVLNVNFSTQYFPSSKNYSFNISAMLNTSFFRMNTSLQTSKGSENSYSEDLSGSLRYDSKRSKLFLSNTGGYNSSSSGGASIRFYIDNNENGIYDTGDSDIEDGAIYVPGATIERDQKGIKRVLNLLPGGRYNLYVKSGSFKNPNILPKVSEFAFIAEPNSIKNIDIPCYMSGMLEGGVFRLDSLKNKEGQSGVKVHLISTNNPDVNHSIPVFSDGTFYKNKLIPDKYKAFVDSTQLKLLNCSSDPEFIEFEIKVSAEGDYVGDLNFILNDNSVKIKSKTIKDEVIAKNNLNEVKDTSIIDLLNKPTNEIKNIQNVNLQTKKIDSSKIALNQIKPGKLENVKFPKSKVTFLSPGSKKYLDKVAEYMIANPDSKIQITGHSDNFGTLDENLEVSKKRASEVATYLLSKGIDKFRLFTNGKGALDPIGDNTAAGQLKNMRVELILLEK